MWFRRPKVDIQQIKPLYVISEEKEYIICCECGCLFDKHKNKTVSIEHRYPYSSHVNLGMKVYCRRCGPKYDHIIYIREYVPGAVSRIISTKYSKMIKAHEVECDEEGNELITKS